LRNFFTLIVALLACISCQKEKDGVYRPDKKITRITTNYYDENSDMLLESLIDVWHWNNKKLSKIDYADGSSLTFEYKNKRLVSMTLTGNGQIMYGELAYENKKLKKIIFEYSKHSKLVIFMKKREDENAVLLQYDYQGNGSKDSFFEKSTARMLSHITEFPCDQYITQHFQSCIEIDNISKGSYHWESTLTYHNGNVTQIHTQYSGVSTLNEITIFYEYDQHNNPFRNSIMDEFNSVLSHSVNNPTSSKYVNYGVENYLKWTYEYEDGWPVKRTYHGEIVEEVVYEY
jgi:hypothetical protein